MSKPRLGRLTISSETQKRLRQFLGVLVSGLSLYLAARHIQLEDAWEAIVRADWRLVAAALGVYFGVNLVKTWRWWVLLGMYGGRVSFVYLFGSHIVGQMLNLLLPARMGEVSRVVMVGGWLAQPAEQGMMFVTGTILVEKVCDMIVYALLFVTLLFLIPLPGWLGNSAYIFVGITLLASVALFWITTQRKWLSVRLEKAAARLPAGWRGRVEQALLAGLSSLDVLQKRAELVKIALSSALIWAGALWINHLLVLAFDFDLPLSAALLTLIALQAGISIPAIPGKIGVFEYVCVLTLGFFKVGRAEALSYGILLHVLLLLPVVLVGLIGLWLMKPPGGWAKLFRIHQEMEVKP
ncbi:MAG: lysylphosphatidylglycerol synthase transmembrane domain-containing protein [Chloroflexota bacterium]